MRTPAAALAGVEGGFEALVEFGGLAVFIIAEVAVGDGEPDGGGGGAVGVVAQQAAAEVLGAGGVATALGEQGELFQRTGGPFAARVGVEQLLEAAARVVVAFLADPGAADEKAGLVGLVVVRMDANELLNLDSELEPLMDTDEH